MYIYVACPYTHKDPEVMLARCNTATQYAAEQFLKGKIAYSPLTHNRAMALLNPTTDHSFAAWRRHDLAMLRHASEIHVLCLSGWRESEGVRAEITFAESADIPVLYIANI
jgi:hypothetical protein